ncbi:hypothetical protein QL285_003055 [Trifolium repens]|nr:hypothetical protein QL285_003055 [Trifolium repens]
MYQMIFSILIRVRIALQLVKLFVAGGITTIVTEIVHQNVFTIGVSSKLQKSMQSSDRHMDSMFPGASFDERCLFHLAYCLVVRSWKD